MKFFNNNFKIIIFVVCFVIAGVFLYMKQDMEKSSSKPKSISDVKEKVIQKMLTAKTKAEEEQAVDEFLKEIKE